jgi:hypothetical protein
LSDVFLLDSCCLQERRARESIATNPYDVEAWTALCNEAQTKPIGEAAPVFEQFLATFPTAVRHLLFFLAVKKNLLSFALSFFAKVWAGKLEFAF